jgi:hypothetical protein
MSDVLAKEIERIADEFKDEFEFEYPHKAKRHLTTALSELAEFVIKQAAEKFLAEISRNTGPTGGWLCSPKEMENFILKDICPKHR